MTGTSPSNFQYLLSHVQSQSHSQSPSLFSHHAGEFYSNSETAKSHKLLLQNSLSWILAGPGFLHLSLPIKCQCCPDIETSQLICTANQLTDFHMKAIQALNGLNNQRVQKCEKCSRTYKIFGRWNMQNQTNMKYSSNPKDIFKSAKKN